MTEWDALKDAMERGDMALAAACERLAKSGFTVTIKIRCDETGDTVTRTWRARTPD